MANTQDAGIAKGPQAAEAHVEARDLTMAFGDYVLQRDLNFTINRGDIFIIMGGSGCGKTTLMHHIVGLRQPAVGQILLNGVSLWDAAPEERDRMLHRMGVSYQSGALWSSMTLAENVALPLGEFTDLTRSEIAELVSLKLALVGLTGFEDYYPSEISGGMQKRAGLARAIALDPEIVFLDEPSAGLAPPERAPARRPAPGATRQLRHDRRDGDPRAEQHFRRGEQLGLSGCKKQDTDCRRKPERASRPLRSRPGARLPDSRDD